MYHGSRMYWMSKQRLFGMGKSVSQIGGTRRPLLSGGGRPLLSGGGRQVLLQLSAAGPFVTSLLLRSDSCPSQGY